MDLIWGNLGSVSEASTRILLGPVTEIRCGSFATGNPYDSLRADPGSVDFILAREVGDLHYGAGSSGKARIPFFPVCP